MALNSALRLVSLLRVPSSGAPLLCSALEIRMFFRHLCCVQLKNWGVTGLVGGKKYIMVCSEKAREMKELIVDL